MGADGQRLGGGGFLPWDALAWLAIRTDLASCTDAAHNAYSA
jgi:hypothetical protein